MSLSLSQIKIISAKSDLIRSQCTNLRYFHIIMPLFGLCDNDPNEHVLPEDRVHGALTFLFKHFRASGVLGWEGEPSIS